MPYEISHAPSVAPLPANRIGWKAMTGTTAVDVTTDRSDIETFVLLLVVGLAVTELAVWDVERKGLPVESEIELLVESGGRLHGRFMLRAAPDTRVSLSECLVAVTLADQVGAALGWRLFVGTTLHQYVVERRQGAARRTTRGRPGLVRVEA